HPDDYISERVYTHPALRPWEESPVPPRMVHQLAYKLGGMEMKAVIVREHGGPEVLRFEETPVPKPGPGEALVRVEAAGVNFIDIYYRKGLYSTALPFT